MIATVIVFHQPLQQLLQAAHEVELKYHLDLVPALTMLTGIYIFHQYRKRQQSKAEASAAAAEAVEARARSEELERLMGLGRSLANALEVPALQQILWQYLPTFANGREFWVVTNRRQRLEALMRDVNASGSNEIVESIAGEALTQSASAGTNVDAVITRDYVCFPLLAGGSAVGVLGVENRPPVSDQQRRALAAAAALIAIAVRNVQLFLDTRDNSVRDSLTGCFTRGHAIEVLGQELRRAARTGLSVSIVMFDIDHFKTINDEHGHLCGDKVLAAVGAQLVTVLRSTDLRCRYGGDEFLIILPDTPVVGAEQVAAGLRQEIFGMMIPGESGSVSVTISLGVAAAVQGELDPAEMIARADEALYRAKHAGRNQFAVGVPPRAIPALPRPAQSGRMKTG